MRVRCTAESVVDLVTEAAVSLSVMRPIQARLHHERQLQDLGDNVASLFQPEWGTRVGRGAGAPFVLGERASREGLTGWRAEVSQSGIRLRASDHTRDIAACLAVPRENKFAGDTHARPCFRPREDAPLARDTGSRLDPGRGP